MALHSPPNGMQNCILCCEIIKVEAIAYSNEQAEYVLFAQGYCHKTCL